MPAKKKKRQRATDQSREYFIFAISQWEPTYSLSVNFDRYRDSPYREHTGLQLDASCVYPKKYVGRRVHFRVWTDRNSLEPEAFKRDPEWIPNCIGLLELPPSVGRFYMSVPHDSFPALLTALAQGLFRYILLWGPPLSRGKSLCLSVEWAQSVNLEEC